MLIVFGVATVRRWHRLLMLARCAGPIGLAAALAVRQRNTLYAYPEERPIIG